MSKKKWTFRIRHMSEAIDEILAYTQQLDFESFSRSTMAQRAVERCLEIIGEAGAAIPEDIKSKYTDIPWNKLKGMRNFLAHQYDEVLEKILWDTIRYDIPALKDKLSQIKKDALEIDNDQI